MLYTQKLNSVLIKFGFFLIRVVYYCTALVFLIYDSREKDFVHTHCTRFSDFKILKQCFTD